MTILNDGAEIGVGDGVLFRTPGYLNRRLLEGGYVSGGCTDIVQIREGITIGEGNQQLLPGSI
jgi:hypothetical protein